MLIHQTAHTFAYLYICLLLNGFEFTELNWIQCGGGWECLQKKFQIKLASSYDLG